MLHARSAVTHAMFDSVTESASSGSPRSCEASRLFSRGYGFGFGVAFIFDIGFMLFAGCIFLLVVALDIGTVFVP
jgi:hypothetical protein